MKLYPEILMNVFISFNICVCVCVDVSGFSMRKVMSSVNRESFTSSFPMWMPFISFSYLIALALILRSELEL